jgi:hypothetical protein
MAYPFSPVLWRESEWNQWLSNLAQNGLKRLILWPRFEFIDDLETSDVQNWLNMLARVITKCREESIEIYLGRSANAYMENSKKDFLDRNQLDLSFCIPGEEIFNEKIIVQQKEILSLLPEFNGWWVIDSDPGDSLGLSEDAFAKSFLSFKQILPNDCKMAYWMWGGWTDLRNQEKDWRLKTQPFWKKASDYVDQIDGNCEYWCPWPGHVKSLSEDKLGRAFNFPYNLLEPEPSFPFIYQSGEIDHSIKWDNDERFPIILNIVSPCLRGINFLNYLKEGQLFYNDTNLNQINEHWIWDKNVLNVLNEKIKPLLNNDNNKELKKQALEEWIEFTDCGLNAKRGYLKENYA